MVLDNEQIIEALIFAHDGPLSAKKIKEILPELESEKNIKKIIRAIDDRYEKNNSPIKIIELAGGFQMVTREPFASWISQLYKSRSRSRLTRKGLETLAIIAYRQPITKVEVEEIRGVSADGVIRTLIERNLITVKGRRKAPGNPLEYGTTTYFLEYFGLKSLKDLPSLKEIDELLKSDSHFLESLDQVALEKILPEKLGLSSVDEILGAEEQPAATEAPSSEASDEDDSGTNDGDDREGESQ
ncbi:MAG: SMC-Scp complex subunit ScpB [Calditrichaeota bacterium]|nr:MAG: SMC-Scp complex subunit ScpB [Calditrichota bacterium]